MSYRNYAWTQAAARAAREHRGESMETTTPGRSGEPIPCSSQRYLGWSSACGAPMNQNALRRHARALIAQKGREGALTYADDHPRPEVGKALRRVIMEETT